MKDLIEQSVNQSQKTDQSPLAVRPVMSTAKHGVKSPTCKVCGDESSGYHYGVDSCEGCKGFFRRCITQGMTHKCSNEEKCEITPFTRNSCQYCRLKKCFSVGMSREASRLGRRPKRLKDSKGEGKTQAQTGNLPIAPYPSPSELYKLRMAELQRLLQQNGTFKSELMQAFLSAAQASFREHQRNPSASGADVDDKPQGTNESGYSSLSSPGSSKSQSPINDLNNSEMVATQLNYNNNNNNNNQQNVVFENKTNVMSESDTLVSNQNIFITADIDNNPQHISHAQNMNVQIKTEPNGVMNGPCRMSTSAASNAADMVDNAASLNMFDTDQKPSMEMMAKMMQSSEDVATQMKLPPIDVERVLEEVRQVPSDIRQTLIDQVIETVSAAHMETCNPTYANVAAAEKRYMEMSLSGTLPDFNNLSLDPNVMWQQFMLNMVPEITLAVKFCKKIPGFGEVSQDDQILLIKQGSFEVLITRFCNLVDHEKGTMWDSGMKMKCPKSIVENMSMGPFLKEFFRMASVFNPLKLTDQEIGLFSSVLIICPDRLNLKNKKAIQKLQSLLMQSLYQHMKHNHADHDKLFRETIETIPLFREINAMHAVALNSMKMQQKFPALHEEVFDGKL